MLKIFRQKSVTKAVLWGLLILILPAFILWGTGAGGREKNKGPTFVGFIDGKKVSFGDFADSINSIRCQVILNYFGQQEAMDAFLKSKAFLGKLAWDRLIMAREARKAHVKVSNDEVITLIKSHPLFSRGSYFDDRMYSYVLRNSMGLEPRAFEEIIRSNLEIQKYNDRLTKDINATDKEIVEAYAKDNDKIRISFLFFANGDSANKAEAGNSAVKYAQERYAELKSLMTKESLSFEDAAAKLKLKVTESAFFSRNESLEGIGKADSLTAAAAKLKPDEVSDPVETEKGVVIFKVVGREKFDEKKFEKEKSDYAKKISGLKKSRYLETWLKGLEDANKLNIDLKDYEKYYR